MTFSKDSKHIILYGLIAALLILMLKWLQWKFLIIDNAIEIYVGLIAIFFTCVGTWVATQLIKSKVNIVIVEKEVFVPYSDSMEVNEAELKKLNLTDREYEVLQLIVKGYTNADIAKKLFLSVSTIKTHVSNLYVKMDVKNRTQAMEKSKRLKITV